MLNDPLVADEDADDDDEDADDEDEPDADPPTVAVVAMIVPAVGATSVVLLSLRWAVANAF